MDNFVFILNTFIEIEKFCNFSFSVLTVFNNHITILYYKRIYNNKYIII